MGFTEMPSFLTVAAISDTHFGRNGSSDTEVPAFDKNHVQAMSKNADIIVHCGDFTDFGNVQGAKIAADVLKESSVPVFGVLGNHDFYDDGDMTKIENILAHDGGVNILKGNTQTFKHNGAAVTLVGASGCQRRLITSHIKGEAAHEYLNTFIEKELSQFDASLNTLTGRNNIVLLHYQPVRKPRQGKNSQNMLRNSRYGELIDKHKKKIKLVLHGHDHGNDTPTETRDGVD